jgi:hypothetical protein
MVVFAIANGMLREFGFKLFLGELPAHWLSTVTFILLLFGYLWIIGTKWKIQSTRQALQIGLMWLGMTIVFEFGFGHYVMGHPWTVLLHDYNIFEGRLWTVVLIAIVSGPVLVSRCQRRSAGAPS